MLWTIHTYGSGDFLRYIFNGIASVMSDGNYTVLLKIATLVGLLSILISSAFKKGKADIQWVLAMAMFYIAVIVPKVDIEIKDEIIPSNSSIVSNVPLGLGVTASAFSQIGFYLTKTFETVFSLPNEIKYAGNGLLFAQKLVEESTTIEITRPHVVANFSDFWKSCVYYDLFLGLYSWGDVLKAGNLQEFFSQKTSQTRAFTYEDESGNRSIKVCRKGFNDFLKKELEEEEKIASLSIGSKILIDEKIRPEIINHIIGKFSTAMPIAYQYLTGISKNNTEIISQNILANSFKRGIMNFASSIDASAAAQDFALAKAESSRKMTFTLMGSLAKKYLPILQGIFEALIYSFFIIVALMAMLPITGRMALHYVKAIVWINLWPPLYAILNFCMCYFSQKAAVSAIMLPGHAFNTGLSLMTSTGLGNVLSDYSAVAGYLSLSIPMISWMIISASGGMMAGLAGRIMDGYDSQVASASEQASSGNAQLGQLHYDNQNAFQSNSAPSHASGFSRNTESDGVQTTSTTSGNYLSSPMSQMPVNVDFGKIASQTSQEMLSSAQKQAESSMFDNVSSTAALDSVTRSAADSVNKMKNLSTSWSESDNLSLSKIHAESNRLNEDFSSREGISKAAIESASIEIASRAGVGLNTPVGELRAGINSRVGDSKNHVTEEQAAKILNYMGSNEFSEAKRQEAVTMKALASKLENSESNSLTSNIASALNNQEATSLKKAETYEKYRQATQQVSSMKSNQSAINEKGLDGMINWMVSSEGYSEGYVKNLISKSNNGDLGAKQAFHEEASKYVKSFSEFNSSRGEKSVSSHSFDSKFKEESDRLDHKKDSFGKVQWGDKENFKYETLINDVNEKNSDFLQVPASTIDDLAKSKKEISDAGEYVKDKYNQLQ